MQLSFFFFFQIISPTWQGLLFVLRLVEMWGNERMLWDAGCALLFFIGILHTGSVGCRGFLLLFQAPMVLLLHFQSLSVEANDFLWHLLTFYLYILGLFPRVLLYTFFNLPSPCFLLVNAAQLSLVTTVRSSTAPPFGKWRKMQLLQQNAAVTAECSAEGLDG